MDAEMLQAIGVLMVAQLALLTGLLRWQLRDMERRLREDMRRDHQELKDLLIGHFHPDGGEAAFRLPQSAGD